MKRKILIAEDNGINRIMLRHILDNDYDIFEAENGKEALSILHRKHKMISAVLLDISMPVMDGFEVLSAIRENAVLSQIPVIVATAAHDEETEVRSLSLGANDYITKPYNPSLILHCLKNTINLRENASIINAIQRDKLTGLFNRETFFDKVSAAIKEQEPGYYIMSCFDIDNFKLVNDRYGAAEGDRILRHIGKAITENFGSVDAICGRISSDNFALLYRSGSETVDFVSRTRKSMFIPPDFLGSLVFSVGRYIVNDLTLSASTIYDRAYIAKRSVKGRYDSHIAFFDKSMLDRLIREQEIIGEMNQALSEGHFEPWFQPQFNHSTGALIGSEALVRWRHPEKGLIPPGDFIPVFEQNGFIYELDRYVWEQTCLWLRRWTDKGLEPLPVSVNISRYDVFRADLVETICELTQRYSIPHGQLRLEITESAFATSSEQIISVVRRLIDAGFTVEIDDFGSGYSSLNTLKDVPANVLKLDMKFLESSNNTQRGGNILESIVRMAKWLDMSVIAEGVETIEQADFLKSIGCCYVQGYLYARPMPADNYEDLMQSSPKKQQRVFETQTLELLNSSDFWDPASMDTLIFNSYVGSACIFESYNDDIELLRVNERFVEMFASQKLTSETILGLKWSEHLDSGDAELIIDAIKNSSDSGSETAADVVFKNIPGCDSPIYLRLSLRVIASSGERRLIYCLSENITAQRQAELKERIASERIYSVLRDADCSIAASTVGDDGRFKILLTNNKFHEIIGYTREQFEAQVGDFFEIVHPDDRARLAEVSISAIRTGVSTVAEYRVSDSTGAERWIRSNFSLTHFPGIEAPVQLTASSDITDAKRAEHELQETESYLRFLDDINHAVMQYTESKNGLYAMLNKLRVFYGASRAAVYEIDKVNMSSTLACESRLAEAYGDDAEKETINYSEISDVCRPVFESHRSIFIDSADPGCSKLAAAILSRINAGSLLAAPAWRGSSLVAVITIEDPTKHTKKFARLAPIGDYVAVMLSRRDLESRLYGKELTRALSSAGQADDPAQSAARIAASLSALVNASEDMVFIKGSDHRYISCNTSYARYAGFADPDMLRGKNDFDFEGSEISERHYEDEKAMLRDGIPRLCYEELLPTPDGSARYADISKYPLFDDKGEIVAFFGEVRDTTSFRETDYRYSLLSESIPGGLASFRVRDGKTRLVYFNDGLARLLGYTHEEFSKYLDGLRDSPIFDDVETVSRQFAALIRSDSSLSQIYRVYTREGTHKWISCNASAIYEENGTVMVSAVILDVTEQQEFTERLRISEEECRLSIEHSSNFVSRYNIADSTLTFTKSFPSDVPLSTVYRNIPESEIGLNIISRETEDAYVAFFESIRAGEPIGAVTFERRIQGKWCWLKGYFSTIFSSDGRPSSAVITYVDITEQQNKETIYRRWAQSFEGKSPDSYMLFRCNLSRNTSFDSSSDTSQGSLLGIDFIPEALSFDERTAEYADKCVYSEDYNTYIYTLSCSRLLASFYRGNRSEELKYREKLPDGGFRWIRLTIDLVEYPDSAEIEAFLYYEDIDQYMRSQLENLKRAETDPLTGILNRSAFAARVEDRISAGASGSMHALLMLDIDHFKLVNDVFGHSVGDTALIDVASALGSVVRSDDLVGRLGGDEFVVFLKDIPGDSAALGKARIINKLIRKSFSAEVCISASIGIAVCPRDGTSFEELYKKADSALYHVKGSGRDGCNLYREDMSNEHMRLDKSEEQAKKHRMLIIDDSKIDFACMQNIFKNDFIIEEAGSGESALIRLHHYSRAVSVVLLDLIMPGMDGFEVLRQMRASPDLRNIPVVVVSGSDDRETSLSAIRCGASDFVTKPIDPDLLRIRVNSAISKAENELLRIQNSVLEIESNTLDKFRTVLSNRATAVSEYDNRTGCFTYDAGIPELIAGIWDERDMWQILLCDGVAVKKSVNRLREFVTTTLREGLNGSTMQLTLRTPSGEKHRFRITAYISTANPDAGHLILVLTDTQRAAANGTVTQAQVTTD